MADRASGDALDIVLDVWRMTAPRHNVNPPATDDDVLRAEVRLGRPLPEQLERFVRFSNGGEFLDGNLMFHELINDEGTGIVDLADELRASDWPIPDDLLVLGSDGAGDPIGLWYPPHAGPADRVPTVLVGAIFEPGCMAIGGTDLGRFLRAESAFYLVDVEGADEALDALGATMAVRSAGTRTMAPYVEWADPSLPDSRVDPYLARLDAAQVASTVASLPA